MKPIALLSCFLLPLASSFSALQPQRRRVFHHEDSSKRNRIAGETPLFAAAKKRRLSASEQERRDEERRRRERSDDVVIGKTSAKQGQTDYALNIAATEQEWMRQASNVEQEIFQRTEEGMHHLKMLQVEEANRLFDRVFALRPNAYLWQAGIAKFYLNQLEDAADILAASATRFESRFGDPATEERIWRNACELKLSTSVGKQERKRIEKLPGGFSAQVAQIPKKDRTDELLASERRKVLKTARELFDASVANDKSSEILSRAKLRSISGVYESDPVLDKKMWKLSAWFYLGLHYDAVGDDTESRKCMKMALRLTPSVGNAPDIVHTLPMLHMAQRDWFDDDDDFESDLFAVNKKSSQTKGTIDARDSSVVSDAYSRQRIAEADPVMVDSLQEGIDELIVEELREALKIRGISCVGSKAELRAKLFDSLMRDAGFGPHVGFSP